MSLKFKYIVFIGFLHVLLVILTYQLLQDKLWLFILTEILVLMSIYFSYVLYENFIKPISLMQSGTDAIKDGDFSITYSDTGSKEIDHLIHVYNQMIKKLRDERISMSEQSFFIQKLIEVTPIGIIIMDYDGQISNINLSAIEILNIEGDPLGKNLQSFSSSLIEEIESIEIGNTRMISLNGLDKYKCQINEVIHQGFKRKFILIDDLSSELLKSEKEAYGRIIRMMAHEVNNSMGAINSILDSVLEFGFKENADLELKESLHIARDRNESLNRFMANYASILRLPKPHKNKLDLIKLLEKCGKLFSILAKEKEIEIKYEWPENKVILLADADLLEQAISNILKNSLEAIAEKGTITITCFENPIGFKISDSGTGISQENEQNIFTPFFSTKPTGQGVGLILIREILELHNAKFSLKTSEGLTHFNVVF